LNCDICGKRDSLFNVEIEGSVLVVCESCAVHGKKLSKVIVDDVVSSSSNTKVKKSKIKMRVEREEPVILLVDNFNLLIKNKRERLNLKQEELAKHINEKESLIQQIESKKIEPSIKVAEKLEVFLKIKLLEVYKPEVQAGSSQKERGPVTLGDVINIKTRKRK
jgi:uncharacterized protein (TIGR00270 family)